MPKIEEMTLEEKVDELLKYQRRQHIYAIIRTVFSFLIFFILVVLPIWGFYYLVDYLRDTAGFNLSEIGETLNRVKTITDTGGIDKLTDFLK